MQPFLKELKVQKALKSTMPKADSLTTNIINAKKLGITARPEANDISSFSKDMKIDETNGGIILQKLMNIPGVQDNPMKFKTMLGKLKNQLSNEKGFFHSIGNMWKTNLGDVAEAIENSGFSEDETYEILEALNGPDSPLKKADKALSQLNNQKAGVL